MKRLMLGLAATALLSCQSSDVSAPVASEGEGRLALRILSDSPLRAVDSVRITIRNVQDADGATYVDSARWSEGGVRLDGLPLEKNLQVTLQGWLSVRGRRQVYWSGTTNTTLSKSSTSWDFTKGLQTVPLTIARNADTVRYVAPALAVISRGVIQNDTLAFELQSDKSDTVRIDTAGIDTVYRDGTPVTTMADGKFLVVFAGADTVELLLVGSSGLTTTLVVQVTAAAPPVQGAGLKAHWESPSPDSWVGDSTKLVLKVDSGTADRVVVRFGPGDSLAFESVGAGTWEAWFVPAAGSTTANLSAFVVGAQGYIKVDLSLNVDLLAPVIAPVFDTSKAVRFGRSGDTLTWTVSDVGVRGESVWATGAGVDGDVFRLGQAYAVKVKAEGVMLHAKDKLGNVDSLEVATVLDTVGPQLTIKDSAGNTIRPGDTLWVANPQGTPRLSVVATDLAGVDSIVATSGSPRGVLRLDSGSLRLIALGTWTLEAFDKLGNSASWGTVTVAVVPEKVTAPSVNPANGVVGANSNLGDLLKFGAMYDTLYPDVRCAVGTRIIRDGAWRDFRDDGTDYYEMAGGVAEADFACANGTDTSDVVHRTWIMLHEPSVTPSDTAWNGFAVAAQVNGTMGNNPSGTRLQMCTGDSATCSATAATWTMVNSSSPDQTWSQSLTSSLKASFRVVRADTANSNNLVYSRAVHRAWGVEYGPRTDWVYPFTAKAADTAAMRSLYGVVAYATEGTSYTLSVDDSGLLFEATFNADSVYPVAGFTLPLDTGWHGWNFDAVTSIIVERSVSSTGTMPSTEILLNSPVYLQDDAARGYKLGWDLGSLGKVLNMSTADYSSWMTSDENQNPVKQPVTLDLLRKNVTGLLFNCTGSASPTAGRTIRFRLTKLGFTGTMKPKE